MSGYRILASADDDLDLVEYSDIKGETGSLSLPYPGGGHDKSSPKKNRVFNAKAGVILLVLVNLLLWAYAVTQLRHVAGVVKDALADESVDTRLLPRPDPLDGLLEFLAEQGAK